MDDLTNQVEAAMPLLTKRCKRRVSTRPYGFTECDYRSIAHEYIARRLNRFDATRYSFKLWMYLCTIRAFQQLEKTERNRRKKIQWVNIDAEDISSEYRQTDYFLIRRIEQIIKQMKPETQQILQDHIIYGYTHEEIAAKLGIEPDHSKDRHFRAIRKIRERLHHG